MEHIANGILQHKKSVLFVCVAVVFLSGAMLSLVNVNYNLAEYLPENAPSTIALDVMNSSFSEEIPNADVYIPDISIPEALDYKKQLAGVPGVNSVLWLDNVVDIRQPLEMAEQETVESWYRDSGALFKLSIDSEDSVSVINEIPKITGENSVLSGEAVNQSCIQTTTMGEISKIMLYVVPLVLLILLLTTSSWLEPVLFLITIGAAIIINEGTNIFIGEISYVTRATSAILQLAVSIDYAVFLLHSFARFRQEKYDVKDAMKNAMVSSASAIAASAATTVFGFLALTFMKFKIGPDMGFVLAKGVLISYISVVVFLPVLVVYTEKLLEKTHHRSLIPSFKSFGRLASLICIPLSIIIFIMIIPSFLAQRNNEFAYGTSGMHSEDSEVRKGMDFIENKFGKSQQMVLLVPEGDAASESGLANALSGIPDVKSVISYSSMVGTQIPEEILLKEQLSQFRSGGYSRLILYVSTPDEGEEAFEAVEDIRKCAEEYYESRYYLTSQSVINYDLMDTITKDYLPVTLASIISIGLVLIITFRSASIPMILLLTIEGAIWINLGLPYFTGNSLNYIGYQIISAVQLGATVDYGILFVQRYMDKRLIMDKSEAVCHAVSETAASILTPAGILATAGMVLGLVSSNGIISQLGTILGRGAIISAAMVLLFLPALLILLDGFIKRTTWSRIKMNRIKGEGV